MPLLGRQTRGKLDSRISATVFPSRIPRAEPASIVKVRGVTSSTASSWSLAGARASVISMSDHRPVLDDDTDAGRVADALDPHLVVLRRRHLADQGAVVGVEQRAVEDADHAELWVQA